jgi:hypothetical protein
MRALVLLLALANAAYFAWRQDYLAPWGFGPAQQSEPERLEQQIKPDALKLKPPPSPLRGQSALPNEVTLQRVPAATATATATSLSACQPLPPLKSASVPARPPTCACCAMASRPRDQLMSSPGTSSPSAASLRLQARW